MEDIAAGLEVLPPDVHKLNDENELNDEDTAAPLNPGLVEDLNADEEDDFDVPCTSADPNPPAKKQQKKDQKLLGKRKI